jgi:hypothetical protein
MAGTAESGLETLEVSGALAEARAHFLDLGGAEAAPVATGLERLKEAAAFRVMATASLAARPQWAGLVDDLFDRPLLKNARLGLRNALSSTLRGDSLYRSVFFSFADAVILWHYGHTQERTGQARIESIYTAMNRLLAGGEQFASIDASVEPGVEFFQRLRRIKLTRDNSYSLLRRGGRLINTVEVELTEQRLRPVRGSMLTSYASFSAQVIAMTRALREGRGAITRADVLSGLAAFTRLVETPPAALRPPAASGAG